MAGLGEMISTLRELNEAVPNPLRLPTDDEVREMEAQTGIAFHPDLRYYLLEASDVVFSTLEPITVSDPNAHTHFPRVLESARGYGIPTDLVPICEDNADFFCIDGSGRIIFWDHNGSTEVSWSSLAEWISEVWIGEAEPSV